MVESLHDMAALKRKTVGNEYDRPLDTHRHKVITPTETKPMQTTYAQMCTVIDLSVLTIQALSQQQWDKGFKTALSPRIASKKGGSLEPSAALRRYLNNISLKFKTLNPSNDNETIIAILFLQIL